MTAWSRPVWAWASAIMTSMGILTCSKRTSRTMLTSFITTTAKRTLRMPLGPHIWELKLATSAGGLGRDERLGAEFRAEFFNGFNHPQFSPPNSGCCGTTSFGQVTSQYNLPRLIQFALKFTF